MTTTQILKAQKVLPIINTEAETALDIAAALIEGGLNAFELTLRGKTSLRALELVASKYPQLLIGAGTITNAQTLRSALDAGAKFIITPGIHTEFAQLLHSSPIPVIPGVSSPGDVMLALSFGFKTQKLFPASALGGIAMLKALSGPFAEVNFCPTGGIDAKSAKEYLALKNVLCVGGSWLAPASLIEARDFKEITRLAKECANLA